MITRERIGELEAFDGRGARVLCAYLDLDPRRQPERSYRMAFENLIRQARERLDPSGRAALSEEAARVEEWIENHPPRGLGLALFSCKPRDLWQAHFLPPRVHDQLSFEPRADVAPLLDLVDEYERYAVALVNKEKARLFTIFMGEIEESDAFKDMVPGKHELGGVSRSRSERHHEAHVHWHLKRVVRRLSELGARRHFDRLIVAGPEEATSDLRRLLPRALAHRLVAVIPSEMTAGDGEILERTLEVERRVEREVEERLVKELFDTAGSGGRATYGLSPTLEALWLREVQTLVVADSAPLAGAECPECGRLEPGDVAACPACRTAMRPLHDLLHRAMGCALEQAGSVEVVHGEAGRRLLEAGNGVGALLRYR